MAKLNQIERAVNALIEKREGLNAEFVAQVAGINAAIEALKAQQRPRAKRTPKAPAAATE